jgi:hypothetical protein
MVFDSLDQPISGIPGAVWNIDATGHQTQGTFGQAIGDPGADTTTIYQSVVTDAAGTNVAADIIAIKAETAAIVADTGTDGVVLANDAITAAKIAAGAIGSSEIADGAITAAKFAAGAIDATAIANGAIDAATFAAGAIDAAALAADAATEIRALASGTADSGTTTTMVDAARTEADADYWVGQFIVFTSGNIAGQARLITAFNAGTDTITFAPATTQAVAAQTYEIWPSGRADVHAWLGTVVATPSVAGVPEVDITHINGAAQTATLDTIKAQTAAIETDTAEIGAAGAGLTNINLPNQTMDIVGNITGNLSGSVGSVTGNVGGNVTGSVGSIATGGIAAASFAAGAIDAAAIAANAIGASELAADAVAEIADAVWEEAIADHSGTAGSTAEALNAAGSAGDPWTTALPGAYGAGSAGFIIGTNINATISSRATQTSVDTIDGIVNSILVDTGTDIPASIDALPTAAENATAVLTTQMTESYAANGVAPTLAQGIFAVHQMLMQHAISGTTWSAYKLDNVTVAFAVTLNDATTPTSARRV